MRRMIVATAVAVASVAAGRAVALDCVVDQVYLSAYQDWPDNVVFVAHYLNAHGTAISRARCPQTIDAPLFGFSDPAVWSDQWPTPDSVAVPRLRIPVGTAPEPDGVIVSLTILKRDANGDAMHLPDGDLWPVMTERRFHRPPAPFVAAKKRR